MVFGLFSKERALKKTIEKATNSRSQSQDRWAAMEKLREVGSEEALFALCRRFSFSYDKTIEDQQEKAWVVDVLSSLGERALPPLRRFMKSADSLGYPLSVLGKIAARDVVWEVIDELLADEEPGYVRDPKRRIDIIEWLGEWSEADNAEVVKRLTPYLEDFDENVRIKTVEAIGLKPHPDAAPALTQALIRPEEESKRLRQRIADVMTDNEMSVGDSAGEVAEICKSVLDGSCGVNKKKILVRS